MTMNLLQKIISWNIQSTNTNSSSKFEDPQFCAIFEHCPFVCLQEIRQPVKYPGFRSFNNTRRDQKHGGVCILIKNEIARGVKEVKSSIEDVVACKLDKYFFGTDKDIFLVNSYIKPANTSCKISGTSGLDIIHELDQFLNELSSKGDLIACGDFNARIGQEIDFIKDDELGHDSLIPLPDDYIPLEISERNSKDKNSNSYKRPFLEMLINNELHILNGRTLGDIYGEFTCIQSSGASVVDYFVISPNCSSYISYMSVEQFTCFSDHKPIVLNITLSPRKATEHSKKLHEAYAHAPIRYKMCPDRLNNLREFMVEPEIEIDTKKIIEFDYPNNISGTIKLNEDITAHLQAIANKCLEKTKHPKVVKNRSINKKPWFDKATREAKQCMAKAARITSDFPDSDYIRKNFYRVKNTYKKLVDRNKNKFFDKLNADQGQKFVAVIKAKNRGAATSQNAKNRGIVAAKIVKIAAMSRQKLLKSRLCRGKLFENRG